MSLLFALRHRLRELVHPGRVDAEVDEELCDHLEREVSRQASTGSPLDEARRQAQRRTGRIDLALEAAASERTGHMLADLARDLRMAIRGFRRSPGFTAAVVLSLALGVGGTTAIVSVVYGVLLRPLPFPQADEIHLVRVWWNDFSSSFSPADYFAVRDTSGRATVVGAYVFPDNGFAMAGPDGPELREGGLITPDLLRLLRVAPRVGRGLSEGSKACEAVIGDTLWHERFGASSGVIGKTIVLDDAPCAIVGVMPPGFNLPGQTDGSIWMRARLDAPTRRGPFYLTMLARVPRGGSTETTEAALTARATPVLRDRYGVKDSWRYGLKPLREVMVGDVRETLLLTLAAVGMVLLIAIANVANLLLARGTVRTRELAVRASIGAGRGRLARQLLTESALLGLVGGALGILLATLLLRLARTSGADIVPRMNEVRVDLAIAGFALSLGMAAGLVAGVLPVLRLPWSRLSDWLREGGRTAGETIGHGRTRRALVVAEIALTLTVVTGAALVVKSLVRVQREDPGFRPDGVLSFRAVLPDSPYDDDNQLSAFLARLETRLRALPGVTSVAYSSSLPPNLLYFSNNYTIEGELPDHAGSDGVAEWNVISADYFRALGIEVARGRAFSTADRAGAPPVAIVNEAFVRRHYSGRTALGKRLKGGDWNPKAPWTTIIGVVRDVPYAGGVWNGASPMVYLAFAQDLWLQSPYVTVRTAGDPSRLTAPVQKALAAIDPRVPLRDVATMSERVHRSTATPRFRGLLFSLFGGLAMALAVTGIYGVMAYHVDQRRRETAIRRALGATSGQVVSTTLGAGLRLAALGIAIGTACALALTRSLSALLYHVDPRDPGVLTSVAALLAIAALVACAVPAARAAAIDPAMILRDE
jgi:putative ABC transport system permease protein